MKEFFDKDGILSRYVEGFSERANQSLMAEKIAEAIDTGQSLIVEAPTGVGKTFAYLLPVFHKNKKAIISTATIVLQHQLYEKDIPLMSELFGKKVKIEILKGRQNYLCLLRYFSEKAKNLSFAEKRVFDIIEEWLHYTEIGDFAEVEGISLPEQILRRINADKNYCTGRKCPHFNHCFFYKARKRCSDADIVLVNHHLFISDLAVKQSDFGNILPPVDLVIIDEAHRFESVASVQFGTSFSLRMLAVFFNQLPAELRLMFSGDFEYLLDKSVLEKKYSLKYGRVYPNDEYFNRLQDVVSRLKSQLSLVDEKEFDLKDSLLKRANGFIELVEKIEDKNFVSYWQVEGNGFVFRQIPLDVSEKLSNLFSAYYPCAVFTSATLSVNGSLEFFKNSIGLYNADELILPPIFSYEKNTVMFVPENIPFVNEENFVEKSSALIGPVIEKLGGKTFVLCTSLRNVKKFAIYLKNVFGFNVLVQGEESNSSLLDRFRSEPNSVLIGSFSFWEGVDIRGKDLSCVVIDRLPFNPPDDPVFSEKSSRVENSFNNYAVPLAVLRLKQGLGRLIRDEKDTGIFIILDKRIKKKRYGRFFIKSLFNSPPVSSLEDVYRFIDKKIIND